MGPLLRPIEEEEQKFTKEQADYKPDKLIYKCGRCKHFVGQGRKECEIVSRADPPKPGVIEETDGCDVWNAGPIRQWLRGRRFGRGSE